MGSCARSKSIHLFTKWRKKTGVFSTMSPTYGTVATARLRLVCNTTGALLRYYLGHSLRATAGVTAAYVNEA